jgi:hypothetical protein
MRGVVLDLVGVTAMADQCLAIGSCLKKSDVPFSSFSLPPSVDVALVVIIGLAAFVAVLLVGSSLAEKLPGLSWLLQALAIVIFLPVFEEVVFRFVMIEQLNNWIEYYSLAPKYELLLLLILAVIAAGTTLLLFFQSTTFGRNGVLATGVVLMIVVEYVFRWRWMVGGCGYAYPGDHTAAFLWATSRFTLGHSILVGTALAGVGGITNSNITQNISSVAVGEPGLNAKILASLAVPASLRILQVGDSLFIGCFTGLVYCLLRFFVDGHPVGLLVTMLVGCWLFHILFNLCMVTFNFVVNTFFAPKSIYLHFGLRLALLGVGILLFVLCYRYGVEATVRDIWLRPGP